MEDNQNLVAQEQLPVQEMQIQCVTKPLPEVEPQLPIFRTPQDEALISSIKTRAIISLVLSIVATFCTPVLAICTIPAMVFAILALVEQTNLGTAESHANAAVGLTSVSVILGVLLLVAFVFYYFYVLNTVNGSYKY